MPELKYMSHIDEYCTSMRTNRTIKYVMGGSVGISTDTLKQYKKSKKWKKDLKDLKKQNKMLYIIANKSGLSREIKNIKKIGSKALKKGSDSSSDDLDSDSLISSSSS